MASTHVLNAIISGETVMVERKHKAAFAYEPICKLIWAMNDLPRVSDANNGVFRRVKVVPFPDLPEAARRPELGEAIKGEGPAILNWALDGLRRLRARGRFAIPQAVAGATQEFVRQNDIVGQFVAECCLTGADLATYSDPLYQRYRDWCLAHGHRPLSIVRIRADWKRLGFEPGRDTKGSLWRGVGLLDS
jgi:putative DNA primase/helicase